MRTDCIQDSFDFGTVEGHRVVGSTVARSPRTPAAWVTPSMGIVDYRPTWWETAPTPRGRGCSQGAGAARQARVPVAAQEHRRVYPHRGKWCGHRHH
jgi:hypothetical protein